MFIYKSNILQVYPPPPLCYPPHKIINALKWKLPLFKKIELGTSPPITFYLDINYININEYKNNIFLLYYFKQKLSNAYSINFFYCKYGCRLVLLSMLLPNAFSMFTIAESDWKWFLPKGPTI